MRVDYRSFPDVGLSMDGARTEIYTDTLLDWVRTLDA